MMINNTPTLLKPKENKEKINFFVFVETVLCLIIVFTTCTVRASITSMAFAISFIVLLVYTLTYIVKKGSFDFADGLVVAIVLLAFINVIISTIINKEDLDFNYMKSYMIFAATILFFRLAENIKVNKKTCNLIFLIQILIAIIYIYTYYFQPQEYSEFSINSLTLNFSNPNLTGMFLLQTALFMVLGFFYFKNFILKCICGGLALVMVKYIQETEARNVFVALALFIVILFLCFFKQKFKFTKVFNFLVNAAPIIFVPMYLFYINVIMESGVLDFMASEGKSLDSRVKIWNRCFDELGDFGFIGNYAESAGNTHNSHMVLLCSYGAIVMLIVILFNCLIVNKICSRISTKFQVYCLAAFFSVIFMGFGEGALYSGGVGIYIFCGTFLILANSDIKEEALKLKFFQRLY